jgi:GMP synthase (glutamine-hydrolysing)
LEAWVTGRESLGFLLLQARRSEDPVRTEERDAFAAQLGVEGSQIAQVDILQDQLDLAQLQDADAVLVGGAGEFGVVNPSPMITNMINFLVGATEQGHPVFASCFGFQALVVGLGGEVQEDEPNAEVGTYTLESTEAAASDDVFSVLPRRFLAQLGHKDRAVSMPSDAVVLARSERCPFQAMKIQGTSTYATQFHPELTWKDNRLRFQRYMEQYGRLFGEEEAQRKLDEHQPSPEANSLLSRFIDFTLLDPQ